MDDDDSRSHNDSPIDGQPANGSKPRQLPADLPTSLDDRRPAAWTPEVEVYDAWQGQSQVLTGPAPKTLDFSLQLNEPSYNADDLSSKARSDGRLSQMLAAQAAYQGEGIQGRDDEDIATDENLRDGEKRAALQQALHSAASNGDIDRLKKLLYGPAKKYCDVNATDEEGTCPLIYASCFGHAQAVGTLLEGKADPNKQDRHQWTALMWATANRHQDIVKLLLDHGASKEVKSSSGRTAFDFVAPDSEISDYLNDHGYKIGSAGVSDDFYSTGLSSDRFEEEMAENEMKRRMMMESAMNLEVDLGNLGLDETPESPEETEEEEQEFIWDRCLNDQMFVFQESDLDRILDIIITNMTPQRTPSQKPVPANILFLSARYAHYHANRELLETLLITAIEKILQVIELHRSDMTILAFWISNTTLLLHYLRKDGGLVAATPEFQAQLAELINEIYVLIIRDAERRMDRVLDAAMLDHETIPGFEDVQFQNEWKLFRHKSKVKEPESLEKRVRPPSPRRRAKVAPRNITSLLSSTLFVLDIYDIHSVITTQILSQLFYWLGAELFDRVLSNRKYMSRTKAMQVRMNVSVLEDWARNNNRQPEHYENGSTTSVGETTFDSARRHLAPVLQLLQWLQVLSSLGDNEALQNTMQQLPRLSPQQLIHAAEHYRAEVGEKSFAKANMKHLRDLRKQADQRKKNRKSMLTPTSPRPDTPQDRPRSAAGEQLGDEPIDDDMPDQLQLDPSLMLPFSLPTSTDMLISYGAGFGGVNRERERKYIPTVPPEFLAKLDSNGQRSDAYNSSKWTQE